MVNAALVQQEHPAIQPEDGGLHPTTPLQLIRFSPCSRIIAKPFIEAYHYSRSVNGVKVAQCFQVTKQGTLVGAMLFGALATTAWKAYAGREQDAVELRRLVMLDEVPKNAESKFIGWTLRWLRKNTNYKVVVSYADPYHGHSGIIYKASNFEYRGLTPDDTLYQHPVTGRLYHSRALRTKYKGEYKPFVKELRRLKQLGLLKAIAAPGKHIYVYRLRN